MLPPSTSELRQKQTQDCIARGTTARVGEQMLNATETAGLHANLSLDFESSGGSMEHFAVNLIPRSADRLWRTYAAKGNSTVVLGLQKN